ncbi:MAG TPA: hypothetical protein PJ988_20220, partial [Anaerolinea sp.]|nr:hypothetical protein [Anaerolinea sp.]
RILVYIETPLELLDRGCKRPGALYGICENLEVYKSIGFVSIYIIWFVDDLKTAGMVTLDALDDQAFEFFGLIDLALGRITIQDIGFGCHHTIDLDGNITKRLFRRHLEYNRRTSFQSHGISWVFKK